MCVGGGGCNDMPILLVDAQTESDFMISLPLVGSLTHKPPPKVCNSKHLKAEAYHSYV